MVSFFTICLLLIFAAERLVEYGLSLDAGVERLHESSYWRTRNADEILREVQRTLNTNVAKNIVFLMGDGYSSIDTTVARIFKDQVHGIKPGGHNKLVYEDFDYNGELRTLSCDNWATDSAAAITTYATGGKANVETLNVKCNVKWHSCMGADPANQYTIITELLKQAGKAVGVVSTTRMTHASPAGFYAHSSERAWESDAEQPAIRSPTCVEKDVARQLVENEPGRSIDVLLSGGLAFFLPKNGSAGMTGRRVDGRDLIKVWRENHADAKKDVAFVTNRTALASVDPDKTDFLFGLFNPSHMSYQLDRLVKNGVAMALPPFNITPEQIQALEFPEPTLMEMTEKALSVLQAKSKRNGDKGYFLYVEGGKIDLAHHDNQYPKALHETLEFERAVQWVRDHTDKADTLIIVSSDHAHSSYFVGHGPQTESILGQSAALYENVTLPYSSLGYATGPGGNYTHGARPSYLTDGNPLLDKDYVSQANIYMRVASHGGQDVPVFASGPWAHLVNGQHDNTYLFDVMTYAACLPAAPEDAAVDERKKKKKNKNKKQAAPKQLVAPHCLASRRA